MLFSDVILLNISSPSSTSEFFIPITGTSSALDITRFGLIFRPNGGDICMLKEAKVSRNLNVSCEGLKNGVKRNAVTWEGF